MKSSLTALLLFFSLGLIARQADTTTKSFQAEEIVSFTASVNANHAQKDGIYLNGYVVHLDYDEIKKLHRKKIRVTGHVFMVKGIPKDREEEVQGRYQDSWHIASPKVEILYKRPDATAEIATITGIVDAAFATKDGLYFDRYVVNLSYDQIQKLNGKKIRVTGEVSIEKGLTPGEPIRQGREQDTRHIENPKVEIL